MHRTLSVHPDAQGHNTNTVLRALRDEGLLEFRRGRGITVTGTPQRSAVIEQAKERLHYARTHGYKPDERLQTRRTHPDHPAARMTRRTS
jgi:DNA-binding FadR family transcriptional regulator